MFNLLFALKIKRNFSKKSISAGNTKINSETYAKKSIPIDFVVQCRKGVVLSQFLNELQYDLYGEETCILVLTL